MIALCAFESIHEFRGTDSYARNLIIGLAQVDRENSYMVITNNAKPYRCVEKYNNFTIFEVNLGLDKIKSVNTKEQGISPDLLWMHSDLFQLINQHRIKVLHFLGYLGLQFKRNDCTARIIATAHGMEHEYASEMFRPEMVYMLKKSVPQTFRVADHIIAVSNNVKNEVIKLYQTDESKITVVHHGISEEFRKTVTNMHGLDYPYILYVGSGEARKNVTSIIRGFSYFKKNNPLSELKLIALGSGFDEYYILIDELEMQNDIIIMGFVAQDELICFYQNAFAFVCLSLYEGFGLIVAEALSCSVPVIVSDIPIFREVTQGAGILIDPHDHHAFAENLKKLTTDMQLYNHLKNKAISMKNTYIVNKMAIETKEIYCKLLNQM